ncbi:alpha/beta hydrolase [Dethiosulfatarculus sandiegensis]|uniref:Alpha/beta hydrolase n=2 Tax=Dethiosulfatarculus sandiegensis TaxID=1429043 RepID=A0A0D2HVR8_9BACT|nr:alpha/beta hydrolase [Dethiosulfatarculus sandiegensis]
MREESVFIKVNESVVLEGALAFPKDGCQGQALILHPHPLYGGSMNNNVVSALNRAALEKGWQTLCFNFRGVERSTGAYDQGIGEVEDVLAAADWLRVHSDLGQIWMGYSFGALMAAKAALKYPHLRGAIWVSPPLELERLPKWPNKNNKLLVISGDRDEFNQIEELEAYSRSQSASVHLITLKGVDHFYGGHESALMEHVKNYLADMP